MSDEQSLSSASQEKTNQQTEIAEIQADLLATHEQAAQIIEELQELKKYLIPNLEQDFIGFSLEDAISVAAQEEQGQGEDEENFDFDLVYQASSRLEVEIKQLVDSLQEGENQLSSLRSKVRNLDWDQEKRRDNLEWDSYYDREPLYHKISSGIKGVFLGIKERKENITKKGMVIDQKELEVKLKEARVQLDELSTISRKLNEVLSKQIIIEVGNKANQLRETWKKHAEKIASSSWINQDIVQVYISEKILPPLEEKDIDAEEKKQFLIDLNAYIQARNLGDQKKQNELWTTLNNYGFSHDINWHLNVLANSQDLKVVKDVVSHLAYEQLASVSDNFLEGLSLSYSTTDRFRSVFKHDLFNSDNYYSNDKWQPKPMSLENRSGWGIDLFNLLKRSSAAKELYGPLLKNVDEQIYADLQNRSLSDVEGGYIDNLFFYPTPETIRILVIIAAADARNYRTNHANRTLTKLAEEENWGVILDHAVENFPELDSARELLETWKYDEYRNHPDIKQSVNQFAMEVLHDEEQDERLRAMAQESLLNNAMIAEMVSKGLISQEDATSYQQTYALLFEISNQVFDDPESAAAEEAENIGQNLWSWEYAARGILKNISVVGTEDEDYQELLNGFQKLLYLGEMCQETRENKRKLSYLSSSTVIGLTTGNNKKPKASFDELTFLNQAYDSYELFSSENIYWINEVLEHDSSYFLNQSGMDFFQQFYDKHTKGEEEYSSESLKNILFKVADGKLSQDNALNFYDHAPGIIDDSVILSYYPDYDFVSNEGVAFLHKFNQTYADTGYGHVSLRKLLETVGRQNITEERVIALNKEAADLLKETIVFDYPSLFLVDDAAVVFGRKFFKTYKEGGVEKSIRDEVIKHIVKRDISQEISLDCVNILPHIFEKEQEAIRKYIFENGKFIAKNKEDLRFINKFLGTHGKQAITILKEYTECVKSKVVTTENREKVLEFTKKFRALSPAIAEGYLEAEEKGIDDVYIAELNQLSSQMVNVEPMSAKDREKPYYQDLIRAIYPNNAGNFGGYSKVSACEDRVGDLAEFSFKPKYEIDLLSAADINVREGETLDEAGIEVLKQDILGLAEEMKKYDFDLEKIQKELVDDVDKLLEQKQADGGLENIGLGDLENLDEKIFILLADSIYGGEKASSGELKKLILRYEFAFFDDIRDYIQGTTDRVSQAPNQDYALMCELHGFFADRIKEINRRLVKVGWENKTLREAMPAYFANVSQERSQARAEDQMNRLRVDRLGMSDSFIQQISRNLEKRRGKKYSPETIQRLIRYYENLTKGLSIETTSEKKATKAFYGQLRAQRDKTMEAVEALTGEKVDALDFHLGDINLKDLVISMAEIEKGIYDEDQFQAFTGLRFLNLFADEKNLLEVELDKFESEAGQQRQVVNGVFTKTKESAHARMVGGVCVSQDNPTKGVEQDKQAPNMWDTEHYFQFVLQDPETSRCQGLVLLHHFEENGEKVMTASFNPSSTYLYSVDAKSLFNGLASSLEDFAKNNGFDKILISQNKAIRTNRTGGEFEKAMNERQRQLGETFSFEEEKVFSYSPGYKLKDMDVIWKKSQE